MKNFFTVPHLLKRALLFVALSLGGGAAQRVAAQEARPENCNTYCYCNADINSHEPRFFCSNQADRYFSIQNINPYYLNDIRWDWEMYSVNTTTGVETKILRLSRSVTGDVRYLVHGYQFPPGVYSYRVRGYIAAYNCYTNWSGGALTNAGLTFNVEADCEFTPNEDYRTAPSPATTDVAVYPNPTSESLVVPANAEILTLLNSAGRSFSARKMGTQLNVQDLPAGLYTLRMRQNGKVIMQRIQVKH